MPKSGLWRGEANSYGALRTLGGDQSRPQISNRDTTQFRFGDTRNRLFERTEFQLKAKSLRRSYFDLAVFNMGHCIGVVALRKEVSLLRCLAIVRPLASAR